MSSSQDLEKCPTCRGIMIILDDFSTLETTKWCVRCGRFYDRSIPWTDDWKSPKYENGNVMYEERFFEGGYGVLRFVYEDEMIEHAFNKPLTEEEISEYRKEFDSGKVKKDDSYLILLIDDKFQLILGKAPDMALLDYEEYYGEDR